MQSSCEFSQQIQEIKLKFNSLNRIKLQIFQKCLFCEKFILFCHSFHFFYNITKFIQKLKKQEIF
jgi:hypothetical protein